MAELPLRLHTIAPSSSRHAVIFLHGVNGNWRETWTNRSTGFFWPQALGEVTGWNTYSIQYDAQTNWGRSTMPLQARAVSIAELLRDSKELAGKDLTIIAHSFGGLVAKQMLRRWHDSARFSELRERLAGIVFLSTPHTGADVATYGHFLRWALGSTVTLEDLRAHTTLLTDLGDWYRNADVPPAHVLYETRRMRLGWWRRWLLVVDRDSANPGIRGATVVPVDADHVEISRPAGTESAHFSSARGFCEEVFAVPARLARYPRQAAAVCFRRTAGGPEFLLVRTTGGRWTFPKGRIETERGVAGSAEQEALEEAGVTGRIEPTPFLHYLHAKLERKTSEEKAQKLCVAAFLFEVENQAARSPERGRTPTFFAPTEAKSRLAEDRPVRYQQELARVIDAAVGRITGDSSSGAVGT